MRLSFKEALLALKSGAAFRIANEARPGSMYLLNSILPEANRPGYVVRTGNMTVRTTMAGLVGMDSPYPEGGFAEISSFEESTCKIANRIRMPEKMLRDLHEIVSVLRLGIVDNGGTIVAANGQTNQAVAQAALNFVDKIIVQGHMDTFEWMRGQALFTGVIDWVFNSKRLNVNYGIPAANFLTNRTGNDRYGGTTSKFWEDVRSAKRILKSLRIALMRSELLNEIVSNDANHILMTGDPSGAGPVTVTRLVGSLERPSSDVRDQLTLVPYDAEGEIIDAADQTKTLKIPFIPNGKIGFVGNNIVNGFTLAGLGAVGQGSTPDPNLANALGYTHIGPTIEGDGRTGRWADVRTPDDEPWSLEGRGVTNGLPVIEAPDRIVVASTDMS